MIKKLLITTLSTLFAANVFAMVTEEVFSEEIPIIWQPIITLSGGPGWASPGLDQYNYNAPPIPTEHYIPNHNTVTVGVGEILFGLQRVVYPGMTGQLGLGLAGVVDPEVSGIMLAEGVPNVYTYTYNVEHARLELKGKLIANKYRFQPFVSASMGVAMNNSHDWEATSANPILYPPMVYGSESVMAFSYTLGAGVQAVLSPHWQVGVGYEFADLGKSALLSSAITGISGIQLVHLYVNSALFSLSFVY